MVLKKEFCIQGNGKVQMVGFRPLLTSIGYLDYQVKVYAANVPGENKIRVVVEGEQGAIERFIKDVKEKKIKPEDMKEMDYEVRLIDSEIINNHDFLEHTQSLQLDQMGTFISEARKIRAELGRLDKLDKLDGMSKNIATMTTTLTSFSKDFEKFVWPAKKK